MYTELRTRFEAPGVQVVYLGAMDVAGKRRMLRDNLGVLRHVKDGVAATAPGMLTRTYPTREAALAAVRTALEVQGAI